MDDVSVSLRQVDMMRNMTGLSGGGRPRRGKYEAYRNFYAAGPNDIEVLNDLVEKGLAYQWSPDKFPIEFPTYSLNGMGLAFLGKVCGLTIDSLD